MEGNCTCFENEMLWVSLKLVRKSSSQGLHKILQFSVCIMINRRGVNFIDLEVIKVLYPNKDQLAELLHGIKDKNSVFSPGALNK